MINSAEMFLAGGIIGVDQAHFTNSGIFHWTAGKFEGIEFGNTNGATLILEGVDDIKEINHSLLVNKGLVKWMNGKISMASNGADQAAIHNFGTWEIHCNADMTDDGGAGDVNALFINAVDPLNQLTGLFKKMAGAASTIGVDFRTTGLWTKMACK